MTLRILLKNKKLSAINIFGLAIGLAASVLIVLYVNAEFSFDSFHSQADRIYRVESNFYEGDVLTDAWATSAFGYGQAMKNNMSGVEAFARLALDQTEQIVGYNNDYIREKGVTYTDPSFFEIFDFKLLEGDKSTMLLNPTSVVISQKVALKLFKGEPALGKVISFGTKSSVQKYEVTGVIEDLPKNSHIQFDYFISINSLPDWKKDFWYLHEAYTYVLLNKNVTAESIEKAFPEMAENYKTEAALKSKTWSVSLVPLRSIHLNAWKQYERETKGNKVTLYSLLLVAIMLLTIAWSNYVNISIAQSYERTMEIAVKKVHGIGRKMLLGQFMFESLFTNSMALVLSVILIFIALPSLSHLVDSELLFLPLSQSYFWIAAGLIFIVGVLLSGFYPAFVLSSFKPIEMLKGKLKASNKRLSPLSFLVVIQLVMSLFLIIGTLTVYNQIQFMQIQSLGINIDDKVVLKFPAKTEDMEQKIKSFTEKLKSRHDIKGVTLSGSIPGMEVAMFASNKLKSATADKNRLYEMLTIDYDYLDTYKIEVLEGRSYDKSYGDEKNNIMINEASLKSLEIPNAKDAIGKEVFLEGQPEPYKIIGVTENWHQKSLNNSYTPIMFILNGTIGWIPPAYITVSFTGNNIDNLISGVENTWKTYFESSSFDYFFTDSFYNAQYRSDKNHRTILTFFTILALIVTCLGLYALTALTAHKRTKEIGVRKVLGANTLELVTMLSKDFINLTLVAFLIVIPIAWYLMHAWLQGFAFHIGIQWEVFIIAGFTVLIITLATISFQSFKVANANPAKSLRTE
ncbi:ABC transporter permease [Flavivirga spongiicola]|uniref:ABC transporter permease n=1 Tax=Flavivirga spongiicola TaxID=421621 RepID=A0ABU7XYZ5_9FLAO|nr:ABC transporter permease [Flavivirga sp. MEBiC05379]MDO5980773.1 ABC transporter permease [Flavivirga sp. MEBiC05379]